MATTSLSLSPHWEAFIRSEVASGRFASASDVVRSALREMEDKGRRLDHIWTSPDIADKATAFRVVEPARSWDKPSDHVPIIAEFDL